MHTPHTHNETQNQNNGQDTARHPGRPDRGDGPRHPGGEGRGFDPRQADHNGDCRSSGPHNHGHNDHSEDHGRGRGGYGRRDFAGREYNHDGAERRGFEGRAFDGRGFSPRPFGPGARFFGGRPEPRKSDIRLMKRVGRIVHELRHSRATSTKEQRAQAVAALEATAVELKRIFTS